MEKETVKIEKKPTRGLKAGINMYTATMDLKKPLSDEEAYALLSNKPGYSEYE
ncbi:MAG TPA: hypothetical protein VF817_00810 [Patescibacteria group bacterium]